MAVTTTIDASHWSGWHRPNRRARWRLICTDADEMTAWLALHRECHGGEFLLKPPGATDPNLDPKPR